MHTTQGSARSFGIAWLLEKQGALPMTACIFAQSSLDKTTAVKHTCSGHPRLCVLCGLPHQAHLLHQHCWPCPSPAGTHKSIFTLHLPWRYDSRRFDRGGLCRVRMAMSVESFGAPSVHMTAKLPGDSLVCCAASCCPAGHGAPRRGNAV